MGKNLPNNWIDVELEELYSHVIGGDWGKDPLTVTDNDFIKVLCIRGGEIKNWQKDKGSTASIRAIKKSSLENRKLQIGDILLEISGGGPDQPVGRTLYIDEDVFSNYPELPKVCTNFLRLVRIFDVVNKRYVNHYLQYFYKSGKVIDYQGGSNNLRNLKFKDYSTIPIPLPPLPEQNRIVEKLDVLFGHLVQIKSRLEKVPALLKNFRQAVLNQAITGKLTEEWRVGRELEEWKKEKLERLCISITDGDHQAPPKSETGIPFLVISNLSKGYIDFESISRFVPRAYYENLKDTRRPEVGSILYTVTGSFGIAIEVKSNKEFCFQRHIAIVKADNRKIDSSFLQMQLSSHHVFMQANSVATGTAQKTVPLKGLKGFEINKPPIQEQQEIVIRVESLFAKADKIEQQYQKLKEKTDNLPQSILTKAFKGELVEQLPTDGDARELLEEIEKAKAELTISKKRK